MFSASNFANASENSGCLNSFGGTGRPRNERNRWFLFHAKYPFNPPRGGSCLRLRPIGDAPRYMGERLITSCNLGNMR